MKSDVCGKSKRTVGVCFNRVATQPRLSSWDGCCDAVTRSPEKPFKHQRMKPTVKEKNAFATASLQWRPVRTIHPLTVVRQDAFFRKSMRIPVAFEGRRRTLNRLQLKNLIQDGLFHWVQLNVTFNQKWPGRWAVKGVTSSSHFPVRTSAVFVYYNFCWARCSRFSQFPQQCTGANETLPELREDEMVH